MTKMLIGIAFPCQWIGKCSGMVVFYAATWECYGDEKTIVEKIKVETKCYIILPMGYLHTLLSNLRRLLNF